MKPRYEFKMDKKVLYLLPTPSMKGGMTATTQMFYNISLFSNPNIRHFDTMFKWGTSSFIRFFESPVLKLHFIYVLLTYRPHAIFVIMSPYWGFYDKISYCIIARLFGVKTVFNSVSGRFTGFYERGIFNRFLVDKLIKIPHAVVLGSPYWMKYFKTHFTSINAHEIGNPVISAEFISEKSDTEKIRVVSAFRITKEKGIVELVEVIKKVCERSNDFVFCIMGDGPELPWVKEQLIDLINKGNVEIKGFLTGEEKIKTIVNSDLYIMLTHFDMMPIALLEAMAASLPVFSTRTGGVVDLIEEGVNGHLFNVGETTEVVNKLLSYSDRKDLLSEMGGNGYNKVKKEYDIEVVINKQLSLIDSLFRKKMSFWDKIYKAMPVFIQNIGISLYGYKWNRRRFGGIFKEELARFKSRESFTLDQWWKYQETELQKLLVHASKNVPYYRDVFREHGLSEKKLAGFRLDQLSDLPLLSKDTVRKEARTKLLSELKEENGQFYASSGSTGTPTEILFSEKMHQRWSAVFEARIRNWAGLSINNARGMIGGRRVIPTNLSVGPFYRYNSAEKQVYFSAYHISANHTGDYVEGMKKHHVDYMTGYAMSNYFLARFIEENNIKAPRLKAVITSSEKLTPEMRKTFSRVYGCKSYDSYSGVEACGLISECEHGKLHTSPDVAIIEIIKPDGTYAKPGEEGEAVCTGFLNYDQPLIRYSIGDVLKLSKDQSCSCGRNMPVIEEIIGRIEDTVIGSDGREMVRFHGIFINIPSIIEGQIIQYTIQDFEVKLVLSKPLSKQDEMMIKERIKSQLGNVTVEINSVDSIPRNQNGKFKAVISHVKREHTPK